LNGIGFDWTVGEKRKIPWEKRYAELKEFVVRVLERRFLPP
jgi:hypothetical protein